MRQEIETTYYVRELDATHDRIALHLVTRDREEAIRKAEMIARKLFPKKADREKFVDGENCGQVLMVSTLGECKAEAPIYPYVCDPAFYWYVMLGGNDCPGSPAQVGHPLSEERAEGDIKRLKEWFNDQLDAM